MEENQRTRNQYLNLSVPPGPIPSIGILCQFCFCVFKCTHRQRVILLFSLSLQKLPRIPLARGQSNLIARMRTIAETNRFHKTETYQDEMPHHRYKRIEIITIHLFEIRIIRMRTMTALSNLIGDLAFEEDKGSSSRSRQGFSSLYSIMILRPCHLILTRARRSSLSEKVN